MYNSQKSKIARLYRTANMNGAEIGRSMGLRQEAVRRFICRTIPKDERAQIDAANRSIDLSKRKKRRVVGLPVPARGMEGRQKETHPDAVILEGRNLCTRPFPKWVNAL